MDRNFNMSSHNPNKYNKFYPYNFNSKSSSDTDSDYPSDYSPYNENAFKNLNDILNYETKPIGSVRGFVCGF